MVTLKEKTKSTVAAASGLTVRLCSDTQQHCIHLKNKIKKHRTLHVVRAENDSNRKVCLQVFDWH